MSKEHPEDDIFHLDGGYIHSQVISLKDTFPLILKDRLLTPLNPTFTVKHGLSLASFYTIRINNRCYIYHQDAIPSNESNLDKDAFIIGTCSNTMYRKILETSESEPRTEYEKYSLHIYNPKRMKEDGFWKSVYLETKLDAIREQET